MPAKTPAMSDVSQPQYMTLGTLPKHMPPPRQLTAPEAAMRLGVSRQQVQVYIAKGRLRAAKVGRSFVVQASDVAKFRRPKRGPKKRKWSDAYDQSSQKAAYAGLAVRSPRGLRASVSGSTCVKP